MRISAIKICNFRGIEELEISLDEVTVLIGENNVGKTSVMEALRCCLGRSLLGKKAPFSEYDFHLPSDSARPATAAPIQLTLTLEEGADEEWPDSVVQALGAAVQVVDPANSGKQRVTFRLEGRFDRDSNDYVAEWSFLDLAGVALPGASQAKTMVSFQQMLPFFHLPALRDARGEFHSRSQFWGPFLRAVQIEETVQTALEHELERLNQEVLSAHTGLETVLERLKTTASIVPLHGDDPVRVEAVPAKLFDVMSRAQVTLKNKLGSRLPLGNHGEGTQNLAVLLLFDAFLQSKLRSSYRDDSAPVLAMEEPEAHLHPSAVCAMAKVLTGLQGQKVLSTHSGALVASVPLNSIRRLHRDGSKIVVGSIRDAGLTSRELAHLEYHARLRRGDLLLARCWLLVEGESDFWIMQGVGDILGKNLAAHGVSLVEFSQSNPTSLLRAAKALGIRWHVLVDGDLKGQEYEALAKAQIPSGGIESEYITRLPAKDIEHYLWSLGHDGVYEAQVTANQRAASDKNSGDSGYETAMIKAAIKTLSKPE